MNDNNTWYDMKYMIEGSMKEWKWWLIDWVNIETMGWILIIDYNYYSLAYIGTESEYGLLLR